MADKQIGEVTNYFKQVKAAAIKLASPLKKGDKIKIVGGEKEIEVAVNSMQIDRKPVDKAKKGDDTDQSKHFNKVLFGTMVRM